MRPHGKQYIYLGFKDAQRIRLRSRNGLIYIRGHRLLSVELATSSDNTISGVDTTPLPHGAPVEGGGGDGLDEVDKFIHDALNQAPPTEGGASPIEGGGEPDLGALGIHGHSEQMVNDRVYKRITRITATTPTKLTTVPPSFISLDFSSIIRRYGIKYCGTQSLANMFRKVEAHAWPGWDGLIVGYDTNTQVYEIVVSNGEFDDAKKNEFDVKGGRHL
ncbi:hypothetical protein RI054_15g73190 [Pseudoscourfieldia marina]